MKFRILPPIYLLMCLLLVYLLHRHVPLLIIIPDALRNIKYLFYGFGFILDFSSIFFFLKANTTIHPFKAQATRILVTQGFYRFTRNPMYLGLLCFIIGYCIHSGSLSVWITPILFMWVLTQVQIKVEEKILLENFNDPYREYTKKVRRWL